MPRIQAAFSLEKSSEEYISFQTFEVVNYCTEYLSLPTGSSISSNCNAREDGETVKSKRQLVHKSLPFQQFFKQYYLKNLLKYKRHSFRYIILSKNHTGRNGESIMPSQVYSHRDFSERLKLEI